MIDLSSILNTPIESDFTEKVTFLCHKAWYYLLEDNGDAELVIMLSEKPPQKSPSLKTVYASEVNYLVISDIGWESDYIIAEDLSHITSLKMTFIEVKDAHRELESLLEKERERLSASLSKSLSGIAPENTSMYLDNNIHRFFLFLLEEGAISIASQYVSDNKIVYKNLSVNHLESSI